MNTFVCPSCQKPLSERRNRYGLFWVCTTCHGRAVTVQMLRKIVSPPVVNRLWQTARSEDHPRKRPCPGCHRKMVEVPVRTGRWTEQLDVCPACHFIWFDHREFESLPRSAPQPSPADAAREEAVQRRQLPIETREAIARARLEEMRKERIREEGGPEQWQDVITALQGIPVEYNEEPLKGHPWLTWALVATIGLVSSLAFRHIATVAANWGLIPAQFARHFGLTFITSFFLHIGSGHLAVNLCFLGVFGRRTEDALGKGRYLLLIVLATIATATLHILDWPGAPIPVVGAGGGIAGVLAYYCLRFPRVTIGMVLGLQWIRIPAWALCPAWVFLQTIGPRHIVVDKVAPWTHLGGAAVGALFWLVTRCMTQPQCEGES